MVALAIMLASLTFMLPRAATASSIAQKAASHRSEAILRQALERADIAREEARAAERHAAEKAAHATAQEEVSASQAAVSEQVSYHPQTATFRKSGGRQRSCSLHEVLLSTQVECSLKACFS